MRGIGVPMQTEEDVGEKTASLTAAPGKRNKNKMGARHVSPLLHICCGEVKPVYRPSFANRVRLGQISGAGARFTRLVPNRSEGQRLRFKD